MIHHNVIQGTNEWHRLHMGRPTASEFDKIITPAKWEPTKGDTRRRFLLRLVVEQILDTPSITVTTEAMQHGKDWEPKARAAYEMMHGVDVDLAGFCTTDDERIGASPDGFVGEDGLLEIKCPAMPDIHAGYMFAPPTLEKEHFVQLQGQLYVTGRKWTDIVSYFGGLPMVTVRVTPVEEFQQKLDDALGQFLGDLAHHVAMAQERGWLKVEVAAAER